MPRPPVEVARLAGDAEFEVADPALDPARLGGTDASARRPVDAPLDRRASLSRLRASRGDRMRRISMLRMSARIRCTRACICCTNA